MHNSPLLERTEIHKSCKALELVVNVFDEYCQAAEAMASAQKKLYRALKDTSSCKGTGDAAGAFMALLLLLILLFQPKWTDNHMAVANGLTAVATVFEALSEVDARLVKAIDRECEGSSSELKKWFKKLAVRVRLRLNVL